MIPDVRDVEEVIVMVAKKIYDNYNYYDNYMVFSFIRPGGQEDQLFMTYILLLSLTIIKAGEAGCFQMV